MTAHAPTRIAIVGCGFTGTTALYQLVEKCPVKEIVVFEASGRFGPGYAYGVGNPSPYLINNTTDTMCLAPSNRGAFLAWLKSRSEHGDVDPQGHLPRLVYGKFLEDVVAATCVVAAIKGISIEFVPEEVIDVRELLNGDVVVQTPTREIVVDAVILATGRCPDVDHYRTLDAPNAAYFPTHIPGRALDTIPLDATVHILGASLSAYDVVNGLFAPQTGCRFIRGSDGTLSVSPGPNKRRVVLASRTGRLKKVASRRPMKIQRRFLTEDAVAAQARVGHLSLSSLLDLVRQEADAHGAMVDWDAVLRPYANCPSARALTARAAALLADDLSAAQGLRDASANFLVDLAGDAQLALWNIAASGLVPAEEEAQYRTRYESSLLTFAAPCPIATGERLLALMRAQRLSVLAGVDRVAVTEDGVYELSHMFGRTRAKVLVNVTGTVDRCIGSAGQPALYRSMALRGALRPHERGHGPLDGVAVDMKTFRASGLRNVYIANMLLWGPGFFTSSAFMMAAVVEWLLVEMFGERTQNATSAPLQRVSYFPAQN